MRLTALLVVAALLAACGSAPPAPPPPKPAAPAPPVNAEGDLPPQVIRQVVQRDSLSMRECYQDGLRRNRRLRGTVSTRFVIARDGHVERASDESGGAFPDGAVAACVVGRFRRLSFPPPDGGKVTVVYPLTFSPD
jgi:hypothetical protein